MNPIHLSNVISRSREEIFDYLSDIANHPQFNDHYTSDWHLTRTNSVGEGAGARFCLDLPFTRFGWGDLTFVKVERPYQIVAIGRMGKFNRIKTYRSWVLSPSASGCTRIDFEFDTEPVYVTDRIIEALSGRRRLVRHHRKALRRLQQIMEDGKTSGERVTVAGI